jgi:hypothetical protein
MARTPKSRTRTVLLSCLLVALLGLTTAAIWLVRAHPNGAGRLAGELGSTTGLGGSGIDPGPPGQVTVRLDPAATGTAISPLIYGVAAADPGTLKQLGATLNRSGGNPSSTYNWVNGHAWNASRDWEFRNTNYSGQGGSSADGMVAGALADGATPLLTVPSLGYVARNDDNSTRSTNVPANGGPAARPGAPSSSGYDPTANQNAVYVPSVARKNGPLQDTPDPNAPVVYQDEWVHHLVDKFGGGQGGAQYYAIDNEPDLWSSTHTDVHPARMGYDDMLSNFEDYATMVKQQDPKAVVLGPVVSGWVSYFYSDLDRGSDNFATHADRKAHGDQAFLPWWLQQVAKADAQRGSRSLDLLDVHYYPQAQGVYSNASDPQTQQRRIHAVRSLYDPSYVDESWIGQPVDLIPRLKGWIADDYPGTGLSISEYSFGGEKDASGAVAEAEALGIFGREGVDLASYWTFPPVDSPPGAAFRLYRNYDGRGGTFGDRSLQTTSSAIQVGAFASKHTTTGEVDVILTNDSVNAATSVSLGVAGGGDYTATRFVIAAGGGTIQQSPMASPDSAVRMPPLTVALVRLMPR